MAGHHAAEAADNVKRLIKLLPNAQKWSALMRPGEYPIPDFAAYVWHRGDALCVALPDYGDTQRERTLIVPLSKLPADAPGLEVSTRPAPRAKD